MEGTNVLNSTSTVLRIHGAEGTEMVKQINTVASIDGNINANGIHINNISSAQPRYPSQHLLINSKEARKMYLDFGVPLYKAALRGDWETAKAILMKDSRLLTASICKGGQTVLHFAAGTKHVHFVEALVKMMTEDELELADKKGNTAFCSAVATGEVQVAMIMLRRNPNLATIRGGGDDHKVTPLYMATMFGRSEMASWLYPITKESLEEKDRIGIFFSCICTGLYGLALEILQDETWLASARDKDNKTALHLLALSPSAFDNRSPIGWNKLVKSCFNIGFERNVKQSKALELVKCLWEHVLDLGDVEAMNLIIYPSELLFDATKFGNFEFLAALISSYPDLIWETDKQNRSIIHIAVLYRHANIYNLIHEIGSIKDLLATYEDTDENNILHLAAKLPPPERLNIVSGPALQMQQQLLWFEEVKKIVQPSYEKAKNKKGKNPEELFCLEHKRLVREGETWMKHTAQSCMLVATLIATVVFAAAFSLPGGNNDKGSPNDLAKTSFLIFVLSDGIALLNSIVAMVMFLSILISRYTEYDFLKRLPLKLIIGLTSLFFSMIAMMVAFSFAFVLAYDHGIKWVPLLISMLAIVPIALFAVLKFPLVLDTFNSTYCSGTLFRPRHMLN
ncbi:ankyrin repeat-containing protein At5g02620 isoform X1 [Cannabis sativa]|nr:ankyrin repeat-containing protein At5g02620 isoform X1 [Cannabis sativa]XP_030479879.1 ankyrin repeat-containing protein At5g02620 isoform X1 [Cannabis sativa]